MEGSHLTAAKDLVLLALALYGAILSTLNWRLLFVDRRRKPVLAELFPLNFAGIPGDLTTTSRTQAQFVAIRERGCNH